MPRCRTNDKHWFDRLFRSWRPLRPGTSGKNILIRPDMHLSWISVEESSKPWSIQAAFVGQSLPMVGDSRWRSSRRQHIGARHKSKTKTDLYSISEVVRGQMRNPELPLYPDLSNICCLIFHGTSYHMRFSRTRYSVTRRGVEDSFGERRSPRFEYISRVCMETVGSTSKRGRGESEQTCMVSKRTNAWATRRFPSLGPPRPRCPSIARMLTIWAGVTSECSVHLNRWFGDVLALSKPCMWLVYGFVVSCFIVLTSPLEGDGVHNQIHVLEIGANAIGLTRLMPGTLGYMPWLQSDAEALPRRCRSSSSM
jgi:hypothetical protein